MIFNAIEALVLYGIQTGLIDHNESVYTRNRLLDVLHEDAFEAAEPMKGTLPDILKVLTDHAVQKGLCADTSESRDIYDTRLMNCLTPRPGEVNRRFFALYAQSRQAATDWFYRFSGDVNYIRRDRIARDRRWKVQSEYGEIDITINLSKPEKDPRDIAAAGKAKTTAYPLCQLCVENVGYAGRIGHPARANHRVLPIDICGEEWFFQYSPYVYYNEHCIVFNGDHVPMFISKKAFEKLFDFVRQFPHYFVGSNADLPIVGGSILSHEHFQGGRYTFAMERAESEYCFAVKGYEDIACGIVKWPLSVIRLRGCDSGRLVELAAMILDNWRGYTDESVNILSETDGVPHNT
ncbi:MAG: galactose-1-phosphate uridylyltransferase, partial [Ruminococcus sp.]|nr:galactose-1-phosphate uridylyltransferase [Ruminococcus sp.]